MEKPIKEFMLSDGCILYVFQGNRGENPDLDIVIRYRDKFTKTKRNRTPQHTHWTIDLLLKREHNRTLTVEFIKYIRDMWDRIEPFRNKQNQLNCELRQTSSDKLKRFVQLNNYGEYSVEFIGHVLELLMIQEKTGLANAFMFKDLLDAIIAEKDIFSIVSKAGYRGR